MREPAFPVFLFATDEDRTDPFGQAMPAGQASQYTGMDLRDYFAAKAMLGLLAEPVSGSQSSTQYLAEAEPGDAYNKGARLARAAYRMADAMLAARETSE